MITSRNTISIDHELWYELGGLRQRVNTIRGNEPNPGLTLPATMELLLCHAAQFSLDPEFVKSFEPISQPGRPRKEKRPSTLLKMRQELDGDRGEDARIYPH